MQTNNAKVVYYNESDPNPLALVAFANECFVRVSNACDILIHSHTRTRCKYTRNKIIYIFAEPLTQWIAM